MIGQDKHIFALHISNFWQVRSKVGTVIKVVDRDVLHRLGKVLRVAVGDRFIFFDRMYHGMVQIESIVKHEMSLFIVTCDHNPKALKNVTFLLPLLKKEALEDAVYSLSEIGVQDIQLIVTQKSRSQLLHAKEFERLQAIVIAAAEQSKNYSYPVLHAPKELSQVVPCINSSFNIVFDGAGESFFEIYPQIQSNSMITALVGPEAGLTAAEFDMLEKVSFQACRLGTTTLRAVQAVSVGAALLKLS